MRFLALAIGPGLLLLLSRVGFCYVNVFYQRFTRAWVAQVNIEEVIGLNSSKIIKDLRKPRYLSLKGGFVPIVNDGSLKKIFDTASSAEELTNSLYYGGVIRRIARFTFMLFGLVGLLLLLIMFTVFLSV